MNEQPSGAGTTAITNAVVYCADAGFTCFNPGSVVFSDGVITADDAYFGYLVSYMEALKGGTTTVMDMYRYPHRGAEAAGTLGMRAHLVPYAADHPTKHFFETLETSEQLIRDCHDSHDGRVKAWLGPEHITYCSEGMFGRVSELADRYGVSIHTHTSEQREEVDVVVDLFGDRPVHIFNERGILRPGAVLAHCVWLDDSEIAALVEIHQRTVDLLKRRESVAAVPMVAD